MISIPSGITAWIKRELRADAVDRLNDIGAGLAEDDDCNRALAIQIAGGTDILHRVRHLATSDSRTAAPFL